MSEEVTPVFVDGLQRLGIEPRAPLLEAFLRYRQELLEWNTRFNLTAIKDPAEILLKHFLDSLVLLTAYDVPQTRMLDIGSGAGFPGLPLKLVRPDWHVTVLEATGKKISFLRHMVETLQLENVEVYHGRAEDLAHQKVYRGTFDLVSARAVSALPALLEYAAPYCRPGGIMVFPKKGNLVEELTQGRRAAPQVGATFQSEVQVTLPGLDDGRSLLVWEQRKPSATQYPRSGAAMLKRPLGLPSYLEKRELR